MATEKRLIDANALSEAVSGIGKDMKRPRAVELACLCMIADAPTVDAVEVVHGLWKSCGSCGYRCSICDFWVAFRSLNNYCPNCGADMRERKDNG